MIKYDIGAEIEAALPNLQGSWRLGNSVLSSSSATTEGNRIVIPGSSTLYSAYTLASQKNYVESTSYVETDIAVGATFNASDHNATYSNNTSSVQPPSISVSMIIKI